MELSHAHFQKFYKYSKGFLEQIFIWPFELISLGLFFSPIPIYLKFSHDAKGTQTLAVTHIGVLTWMM